MTSPQGYITPNVDLPKDQDQKDITIRDWMQQSASATNLKTSGIYNNAETQNGELYFNTSVKTGGTQSGNQRAVYRKVINFGALPNATSKSVAHGITWTSATSFTRIYGTSTRPSTAAIPIPFASSTDSEEIKIALDTTNVTITTAADYSAYTVTYVVLEYLKV